LIILGIDPGIRNTGYGAIRIDAGTPVLLEAGVLCPPTDGPFEQRLRKLFEALQEVLEAVRPDMMVVEEIWVGDRDPQSALTMGHARGVLCLAAALANIEVKHLAHTTVKRAVTGSGRASKLQVKHMIVRELKLRVLPEPDDVSDALAVALAQANLLGRSEVGSVHPAIAELVTPRRRRNAELQRVLGIAKQSP
jgi:crossover junction endodeoxyribonuclease RuvC